MNEETTIGANRQTEDRAPWLVLIYQLPPKPAYFRVKIWRRLQVLGAINVKNSVYVLPRTERTIEDLQWVRREIEDGGGEAAVCEVRFLDGLDDGQIRSLFQAARDPEYRELAAEAQGVLDRLGMNEETRAEATAHLRRLRRRFTQVSALDFFGAPGRAMADTLLNGITRHLTPTPVPFAGDPRAAFRNRTWVTRAGVEVDRIASSWLIRHFIDSQAVFRFVASSNPMPAPGEVRFDMFEAEFTHVGDLCTFEVLMERMQLDDRALRSIAEIVHDLDVKDDKFHREEAAGLAMVFGAIITAHTTDEARITRGGILLDDLYRMFGKRDISPDVPHHGIPE